MPTGLEVDEEVGARFEMEVDLVGEVVGVEKDDFVFVVPQVPQGVEEWLLLVGADEGVGEEDDEGAPVELFGEEVEGLGDFEGWGLEVGGLDGLEKFVEFGEEVLSVGGAGAGGGGGVAQEGKTEGIALAMEELNENCGGIDAEGEFVGTVDVAVALEGVEHGGGGIDNELAAQVGLLFELFDIEAVGAPIEAVVDVTGAFAGVVLPIVGELDGEAVKRTFMSASDEAFDDLTGEEVEGTVTGDLGLVHETAYIVIGEFSEFPLSR